MATDEANNTAKPELRIGSYRLLEQLGSGGMSSVFRATHVDSGHEVAVKVLPRALAKNPTLLQRFLREAKSAEALEHPNIVAIFDRGVDQGRHYLVLEYVPGGDLHERVRTNGPLPIAEAVRVIKSVAEGLRFAAGRGLIHRDIKPANILVAPSGQVKIIDLGLALQAENEDERVTRDGTTVGTVDYMSPEQARDSRATNEQSDMYSLGCTLYFLLTGSAPYPGGDLADKLSRHCTASAPDPRALRPETPEGLARLVLRLMAKRPEQRFANYDQLIAALERVSTAPASSAAPLDALIDDDEEDEAPLEALIDDEDDESASLEALIDDEDDEEAPGPPQRGLRVSPREAMPQLGELPLAELAALEGPEPRAALSPPRPAAASRPDARESFQQILEDAEPVVAAHAVRSSRGFADASADVWIKRCILIGVSLILFVIGVDQLIRASRGTSSATPESSEPTESEGTLPGPPIASPSSPVRPIVSKKPADAKGQPKATTKADEVAWVEPRDPTPEVVPEVKYPAHLESAFVPDWANATIPDRLAGPLLTVRRIPEASSEWSSLRQALGQGGGTIEVADDGPFFEHELPIQGDGRMVRARAGVRPIVALTSQRNNEATLRQQAIIALEGKNLTLQGLDLVVEVEKLPREVTALFLCRGGTLTLSECTITVVNPKGQPFTVIRTGASLKPSRVRLDRTFVRGQGASAFDLAAGAAEVAISRSAVLTAQAPVLVSRVPAAPNAADSDRRIAVARSLLAARGPVFELVASTPRARSKPLSVRALGSTFACVEGANPASLVASRESAPPAELVDWRGDANVFTGWKAWVATGADANVAVADLPAARRVWPRSDSESHELALPWPDSAALERAQPRDLASLSPERKDVLARVASPSPFLLAKSIAAFDPPVVPTLAPRVVATTNGPTGGAGPRGKLGVLIPGQNASVSNPLQTNARPPMPKNAIPKAPAAKKGVGGSPTTEPPSGDLTFDVQEPPWNGDLGAFLRSEVAAGMKKATVRVFGSGAHVCSPIRMPDGVSLEIVVEPLGSGGGAPLSWFPGPSAEADALIDVRGADLVLSGVVLRRDATARPRSLVRVEGGHLVLERCRLLAPGVVEQGGGGLIVFHAPGTKKLARGAEPFTSPIDRPVCRLIDCVLISGGEPIVAEVGRGMVALTHCAIAAGQSALSLHPSAVARAGFDADLVLDHCTLASERNFLRLGAWKGNAPGPDRPWLVTSQESAFVAYYAGGARESVLLRADPAAMAQGALLWQGTKEAYDVTHFTASGEARPTPNPRPDVQRQWVEFWGPSHIRRASGPSPARGGTASTVRFVERLRPGNVAPDDLVLDPRTVRDRNLGADPVRLGLASPRAR